MRGRRRRREDEEEGEAIEIELNIDKGKSSDRMSRRDSDSEDEIDYDELNELDDKVGQNRVMQTYVAENCMVLFQMLFGVLSDSHVRNIANLTEPVKN